MTDQHHKGVDSSDGVEADASKLRGKFGDLASTYAETRAEAAELAGAEDADHWRQVNETIEDEDDG